MKQEDPTWARFHGDRACAAERRRPIADSQPDHHRASAASLAADAPDAQP